MKSLEPVLISGREVLPIIEGGKGVAVSNGLSAGAFAAAGCVGTVSGVNADSYDQNGEVIRQVYHATTRRERWHELIAYAIDGGIAQLKIAHEKAGGQGRIHVNVLWEAGGTPQVLEGILTGAKGLVHGVTCGAGMPYKVAEIVSGFGVYYHPIISSARAFKALWKRAYHKYAEFLGSVVYEDPWLAGGHNGLSNVEDPEKPQDPYPRIVELRKAMREFGLDNTPIVMAGGVWYLREWQDWIGNPELGPIAFQFGTRPLLTRESPVSKAWQDRLLTLQEGDIFLNKFSPTGFYSSAVRNNLLNELEGRSLRQVPYSRAAEADMSEALPVGVRGRPIYLKAEDKARAEAWIAEGYSEAMKTPDNSVVFVTPEKSREIVTDQQNCMGCLSQCRFSNWAEGEAGTTGKRADPRSFCIQKTLQDIAHGGSIEDNLMFSGHNAFKFGSDPFYKNGFVPSVQQLVNRLVSGD
ncbi:MAG: nitronate monooxygenase [Rhodospirillaceae bacterium]|nr:nitronate monooxygenase [Rhodospirillaceae bacterium]MBL6942056.1 nitronate monooxygenase [Rhodospirillales bacterium]